jgi:hypothetical protein
MQSEKGLENRRRERNWLLSSEEAPRSHQRKAMHYIHLINEEYII